jgi:hypothetical protein
MHFWRYYDVLRRTIADNRNQIMQLTACGPETPRHSPPYAEVDIFAVQEKVIDSIVADAVQQHAASVADKPVSEEQNIVAGILRNPALDRAELRELRQFLKQPLVGAAVQRLRDGLRQYSVDSDVTALLGVVRALYREQGYGDTSQAAARRTPLVTREDLHLVCYEYIDA